MLTKSAIEYFGTQAEICRVLGISSAAVAKWGEVVPLESALALEIRTNKALPVVRSLYPNLARALEAASQQPRKSAIA
jgi:hypothetical protein